MRKNGILDKVTLLVRFLPKMGSKGLNLPNSPQPSCNTLKKQITKIKVTNSPKS